MDTEPDMKQAPSSYCGLLSRAWKELGYPYERRPVLIGIDGRPGAGKSSLASWLAWQLGAPAIHLDLFLVPDRVPPEWRLDDLSRAVQGRLRGFAREERRGRPLVVEGILLLDVLEAIGLEPDLLVHVVKEGHDTDGAALGPALADYRHRRAPSERADVTVVWSDEPLSPA
ncbi:hypothetical protein [Roseomonas genomospecies 6]|uniref:Uridine kinase n=1 Tax=Roseomonas genomospecies 6 TaxID=214106 RepID=A0A9W7NF45_9PROT|nr:hypothetical protein [Roseomonas genomospecies 6]KAA0675731.1 hypothetical protein DS843_30250 [Roseomonas genomospecies 6]